MLSLIHILLSTFSTASSERIPLKALRILSTAACSSSSRSRSSRLVLDRKLSEKRIFPAIDIVKSGTRREDLLLDEDEQAAEMCIRDRWH